MASTTELEWVERPWGGYLTVYSDSYTTVKILRVNPSESISLQLHEHRDEFWTLLRPHAGVRFIINGSLLTPLPNVRYHVPRHVLHRITNDSLAAVEILEVIKGKYDEEDITRIHDKYGRTYT